MVEDFSSQLSPVCSHAKDLSLPNTPYTRKIIKICSQKILRLNLNIEMFME